MEFSNQIHFATKNRRAFTREWHPMIVLRRCILVMPASVYRNNDETKNDQDINCFRLI